MANGNFVVYLRVSTAKQGTSGLGLEAQRKAVADHLNGGKHQILAEFVEIESGNKSDRPELAKAMAACKKHKATLLVAKLDRLARNVHFISGLMESKIDFVAADFPTANQLTIHILAAVAQHEREMISTRTKAALAAKKADGVRLGGPNIEEARKSAIKTTIENADRFATNVMPIIREIQGSGVTSANSIAKTLNSRGIKTARGKLWTHQQVCNMIIRDGA